MGRKAKDNQGGDRYQYEDDDEFGSQPKSYKQNSPARQSEINKPTMKKRGSKFDLMEQSENK